MWPALVRLHRWLGLATVLFLAIAGLTGSLLAWDDELDAWLAPQLHRSASPSASMGDPFALRADAEVQLRARWPQARLDEALLSRRPGRTLRLRASSAGEPLPFDEVFVDPATGHVQGVRDSDAIGLSPAQLMPFVFRLHTSLALPSPWGTLAMGVVALLWTIDCVVGAALTLPRGRGPRPWWARWGPAWRIKWPAGAHRVTVDVHRAGGLWPWALLLVFAWSSVMFNLRAPVYQPVMSTVFAFDHSWRAQAELSVPLDRPALTWPAALAVARDHMAALAARHGFSIAHEQSIALDRRRGLYAYMVRSSLDLRDDGVGNTAILIDADRGDVRGQWLPTGGAAGNTVSNWLGALHMGQVFGAGYRAAVSALGVAVTVLGATGVLIWRRKRRARRGVRPA